MEYPLIIGRTFFTVANLILDGEQGKTIVRTQDEYKSFKVTYHEMEDYYEQINQSPEWLFIKGVIDAYAKRKVVEEEARENLTAEDCDQVEWYEDKEPEGQGLPSTT